MPYSHFFLLFIFYLTMISRHTSQGVRFTRMISQTRKWTQTLQLPPLVYSNEYSCTWPSLHRFPMNKFHKLREELHNYPDNAFLTPSSPLENLELMKAVLAVHDKDYIDRVITHSLSDVEKRRIGLYYHEYDKLIPKRTLSFLCHRSPSFSPISHLSLISLFLQVHFMKLVVQS